MSLQQDWITKWQTAPRPQNLTVNSEFDEKIEIPVVYLFEM